MAARLRKCIHHRKQPQMSLRRQEASRGKPQANLLCLGGVVQMVCFYLILQALYFELLVLTVYSAPQSLCLVVVLARGVSMWHGSLGIS